MMKNKKILLLGALVAPALAFSQQNTFHGTNGEANFFGQNNRLGVQRYLKNQRISKERVKDTAIQQNQISKGLADIANREAKNRLQGVREASSKEHTQSKIRAMAKIKKRGYQNALTEAKKNANRDYQKAMIAPATY